MEGRTDMKGEIYIYLRFSFVLSLDFFCWSGEFFHYPVKTTLREKLEIHFRFCLHFFHFPPWAWYILTYLTYTKSNPSLGNYSMSENGVFVNARYTCNAWTVQPNVILDKAKCREISHTFLTRSHLGTFEFSRTFFWLVNEMQRKKWNCKILFGGALSQKRT